MTTFNKQEDHSRLEQTEKMLRGSENRFRLLVEQAGDTFFILDTAGTIIDVNDQACMNLGYTRDEFLEMTISEVDIEVEKKKHETLYWNSMEPGKYITFEGVHRHKNGNTFPVEIRLGRMDVGEKRIFLALARDITERKQLEELFREKRLLLDQAGDAFFVFDDAGTIIDVNHQACLSLGYTRDELLKLTVLEVDIEAEKKKQKPKFWDSLDQEKHITFEGVHLRKDGSTFPVEVRLGRLDLCEKRLLLALARDITVRKQKEEELIKAFIEIKELKDKLEEENIYLRKEIELKYRYEKIVGESDAIKRVLSQAEKVANTDTCVLILGETGTGKELLAHAIHNMSSRKAHAMVNVNCAALPATLIESELFGREKGAFTGALKSQIGRFEAAHGSTIFLDEIGDLPIELQAKLLRVLQEGEFERLGSTKTISVDVRVIAATNRNLGEMANEQKFRKDLYYRLNVFPITLPPLRERQEDIPLLVWALVSEFVKSMGKPITKIQKKTMTALKQYAWPGNVRELKNVIERAMIMSTGSTLQVEHIADKDAPTDIKMSLAEIEKEHILKVLDSTNWRVRGEKGAAKILELKPTTLEARMKKMGIRRQT